MKTSWLKTVVFAIVPLIVLLGCVELFFRVTGLTLNRSSAYRIFSNEYAPYLGFINAANARGKYTMQNQLKGKQMEGQRSTNNWGYRADINYDFVKYYEKKDNERIVLLTGGSAAAGAGASDDTKTIDARMQHYLNILQNKHSYRVFNFANGGWVAMQELIGVQLFGKQLDPDWIVTMNGRNDIAVCTDHNEGLAKFMHYAVIASYVYGYLEQGGGTSFYRGELENFLVKNSAAYRSLTGKVYIPRKQYVIKKYGQNMVGTKVTWKDVEGQIEFYVRVQESFLGISDKAKYILSLQPLVHGYSTIFNKMTDEELKKYAIDNPEKVPAYNFSSLYFYREAQRRLGELAKAYQGRADVQYVYSGIVFDDRTDDGTNFFDEAHMTDLGEDKVAKLYALMILRRDFPERKAEFDARIKDLIVIKQYPFEY